MITPYVFVAGIPSNTADNVSSAFMQVWGATTATNIAYYRAPWLVAGTIGNGRVDLGVAPGAGKSWTFTLYINNVSTAVSVTISDAAVSGRYVGSRVAVAVGDMLTWRSVPVGTPTSPSTVTASFDYDSTTARQSAYAHGQLGIFNTTQYFNVINTWDDEAAERLTVIAAPGSVTLSGLAFHSVAGTGGNATLTLKKNGVLQDGSGGTVNTTLTTTCAAAITALVTQAYTLPVVAGDTIVAVLTTTTQSSTYSTSVGFKFEPTVDGESNWGSSSFSNIGTGTATLYARMAPAPAAWAGTAVQSIAPITAVTLSQLYLLLGTGPGGSVTRTFAVQKASADTALSAALTGATTTASDLVDSVSLVEGDLFRMSGAVSGGVPAASSVAWGLKVTTTTSKDGSSVFGVNGTVTTRRAVLFSLDGATNTHSQEGELKICGDFEVTGTAIIPMSASLDALGT